MRKKEKERIREEEKTFNNRITGENGEITG